MATHNKSDEKKPILKNQELSIELSEEIAEGTYSNLVITKYSQAEFILDFINIMPNTPKSKVKARIIMTPQHTKKLLQDLADNLKSFEEENGEIKDITGLHIPLHFGGPTAQA